MRRITILFTVCLMFAFSGCQVNTLDNQGSAIENVMIAENIQSAATQRPASTETAPPAPGQNANSDMVEIKEKTFIAQINDIYLNQDDYLGKTIKYEGMFTSYTWEEVGMTYYFVYRQSPGCCGMDGQAGFEVLWPDGSNKSYPNENDWCEVVGTLGIYEEDECSYLHIVLDSLTVKSKRGAEFVSQ